jgi:hypothetical protein
MFRQIMATRQSSLARGSVGHAGAKSLDVRLTSWGLLSRRSVVAVSDDLVVTCMTAG